MGHIAYIFESMASSDVLYRCVANNAHYLRHLEIYEKALRLKIPRDFQVLEKEEGRSITIQQGGIVSLYEFLQTGNTCQVNFRIKWGGKYRLVMWARKKQLLLLALTELLSYEHAALVLMER